MRKTITLRLPKSDVEAFLRAVQDIKFIREAENGDKEINSGRFKTLGQLKNKSTS